MKNDLEQLKKEKLALERENKELKMMLNSKRFRLANKMGNAFNSFFPVSSRRRIAAKKLASRLSRLYKIKKRRALKPLLRELGEIASGFDKVIIINSIPWDVELRQRPHHLAIEFAKLDYLVLFLECSNYAHIMRKINESLVTINNPDLLEALKDLNKDVYFMQLSTIASISVDDVLHLKKNIGAKIIYDYIDELHEDISGDLYHQRLIWDALTKLRPTLISVTSDILLEQVKAHYNKAPIVVAKNAVNVDHFDFQKHKELRAAKDLKEILASGKPVVGYYGALAPWLDYDMLNNLAKKRPDLEFVYVGIDYNDSLKNLRILPNVHYLGAKKYSDLPKYSLFFDVATIPFVHGDIAKATSPVKLFEYMAAGAPTVCTRDLLECKGYDFVFISDNDAEFESNIDKAIKSKKNKKNRQAMLEQAKRNTWAQKAKDIDQELAEGSK